MAKWRNLAVFLCGLSLVAAGAAAPVPVPRTDDWGDPGAHPPEAVPRTPGKSRLLGHRPLPVHVLAFSPDGKLFATSHYQSFTGGVTFPIHVWDAHTGRYLRSLPGHHDGVMSAAFSTDGKVLASDGMDNALRFWDVTTGKPLGGPLPHEGHVYGVHFTPDGKRLVSASNELRLWDAGTRKEVRKFEAAPKPQFYNNTLLSPDGKTLATYSEGGTFLWSVADGKRLREVKRKDGSASGPAFFSADSKSLFCWEAGDEVGRWDVATGKQDPSGTVKVPGGVGEVRVAPGGGRLLGVFRGWPAVAELGAGKPVPLGAPSWKFSGAISADGKMVALGREDGSLELWDAATGKLLHTPLEAPQPVISLHFAGPGRLVSLSADGTMRQWDVAERRELRQRRTALPEKHVALRLAPDGAALASVAPDGGLRLCDAADLRELWLRPEVLAKELSPNLPEPSGRVARAWKSAVGVEVAFSADGRTVAGAAGDGQEIAVWDVRNGKERRRLDTPKVCGLALSGDGKTLFGSVLENERVGVRVWDVASGKELRRAALPAPARGEADPFGQRAVTALASSPDGKALAIVEEVDPASDEGRKGGGRRYHWRLHLWDAGGKAAPRLIAPQCESLPAFSPDGKLLAFADRGTMAVWDVAGGVLRRAASESGDVTALAFSPDGKTLAAGGADGTIVLWDVRDFKATKPDDSD
jgi:WD40 repeat protein